jgi:hypothetical protein
MMIGLVWKLDQTVPAPAEMKLGDKGVLPTAVVLW